MLFKNNFIFWVSKLPAFKKVITTVYLDGFSLSFWFFGRETDESGVGKRLFKEQSLPVFLEFYSDYITPFFSSNDAKSKPFMKHPGSLFQTALSAQRLRIFKIGLAFVI